MIVYLLLIESGPIHTCGMGKYGIHLAYLHICINTDNVHVDYMYVNQIQHSNIIDNIKDIIHTS